MGYVVHIITVGTSLLTNKGYVRGNYLREESLSCTIDTRRKYLNKECRTLLSLRENEEITNDEVDELANILMGAIPNPRDEVGYRTREHYDNDLIDRLPQEISYLCLMSERGGAAVPKDREKCYLLPSNTPKAICCAEVIKKYIFGINALNHVYEVTEIRSIKGLDPLDGKAFRTRGVSNMLDAIHEIIECEKKTSETIYINVTGGFKGTVPYATLMGILHARDNVVINYLFEDSQEVIPIPSYPIGLDFEHWHRNAIRFKMYSQENKEVFLHKLSPQMQELAKDTSALKTILENQYEDQIKTDPLQFYSREIVEKLLPGGGENEKYRIILNNVIDKAGIAIWTGDKIPEMVEHAQRHHHHLLEFAELFLTPILAISENYLNSAERFCLLAGILLHDCGHSIDYMHNGNGGAPGVIPLFPSEVRYFHHLLSAQRLSDEELSRQIGWYPRGEFFEPHIANLLHEAVLDVCRYHRKKSPYVNKDKPFENYLTGEKLDPLESSTEKYRVINVDIMKVVALMRIIDGCDNQSRRPGSGTATNITLSILEKDKGSAMVRARQSYEALQRVCRRLKACGCEAPLCDNLYIEDAGGTLKLADGWKSFRKQCLDLSGSSADMAGVLARLWLAAAHLVDAVSMKSLQRDHYIKHLCIREVLVIPAEDIAEYNYLLDIVLSKNDDRDWSYLDKTCESDEEKRTFKCVIEDEISSEYKGVENKIGENPRCLKLRYWWEEAYRERYDGGCPFYPHVD